MELGNKIKRQAVTFKFQKIREFFIINIVHVYLGHTLKRHFCLSEVQMYCGYLLFHPAAPSNLRTFLQE